jgi:membrane associated rhomboid family serine protease
MLPLWDMQDRRRAPVVTATLVAAMLAVFVYEVFLGVQGQRVLERFVVAGAVIPERFVTGWRGAEAWADLFTAMFLHGGIAHVAGNAWFLWVFGRSVEDRVGSMFFGLLYVVAGVAAALIQIAVEPDSRVPMIGASGAISGVLGAYFLLLPSAWVVTLVPWLVPIVPLPAVVFLLLWFLLQMSNGMGSLLDGAGGAGGGIAWWAHIGGFLAGIVIAWGAPKARRPRRRARR